MINVTKSFLPDQSEYSAILKSSWDKSHITNRGPLVEELEEKIKDKLKVSHIIAMTNGTLPLQIAIKALELTGEIITTPFSYIATASSIFWENCTPVFADIQDDTFNINPKEIESKITSYTSAIMATHVFGNPCDVEAIQRIAEAHNLKVIYDAAHTFGVDYKGTSIFEYGDVSTCSFHATKIFHTGEGGAIFTKDKSLYQSMYFHHNFGHSSSHAFSGVGINAKMSELQAAMGLAVFPYFDDIVKKRESLCHLYLENLKDCGFQFQKITEGTTYNYAYFPVVFESEDQLDKILEALNQHKIFPRRYFYPSLNTIDYLDGEPMPISESIAERILCLPLYYDLTENQVNHISDIIKTAI